MPDIVVAAGAVVLRHDGDDVDVLLVHRPKYDDWSLPKGKLDPDESPRAAAVREVEEETGVQVRLGPPLGPQVYPVNGGVKVVHWWVGYARAEHDVSAYQPNAEIGDVRWLRADKAADRLSYERDRATLEEALTHQRSTVPVVVVRHAAAHNKKRWKKADAQRPLSEEGKRQALRLPPDLGAYGPERLVSSSSKRCWTTLVPYAEAAGTDIERTDALSQADASAEGVQAAVDGLLEAAVPLVVCSHRPVLPWVFEALQVEPPWLDPAAIAVVHHRDGLVAAIERIAAPPGE
jgi:8-oxo-dGTP diphosphatase